MDEYLQLFKDSVLLTKRAYLVVLGLMLLSILTNFPVLYLNLPKGLNFIYITVSVLLVISYTASLPFFIFQYSHDKPMTLQGIAATTLHNAKRLLAAYILFYLLVFIFFTIVVIIAVMANRLTPGEITNFLPRKKLSAIALVIGVALCMYWTQFAAYFFSVQEKSVINSIKKGIVYSAKHWRITGIFVVIEICIGILGIYLRTLPHIGLLVQSVLANIITVLLAAVCVLYYSKKN